VSDDVRFDASFVGIGRLLRSPMMAKALLARAELVKARAIDIAPVGNDTDPHAGRYRKSFGVRLDSDKGRIIAVVFNSAPEAIMIEKGNSKIESHNVLMRALDIIRGL
jgi:hypothetical protein